MMTAIEIDPRKLQPSNNPRRKPISPERISEIARSMSDPAIGVIEALVVRALGTKRVGDYTHQVIAGDTRRLAALEAQLEVVPCVVKDLDDLAILKLQLIENIQRNDMHYIDEGEALAKLVASKRETIDSLVETFGKSRRWVYQRIEFTKLIPEVKKLLVSDDRFTASHAERLVRLNEKQQKAAMAREKYSGGGLWQFVEGSKADGTFEDRAVPASVDELDSWIEQNATLDLERPQTGELFPEVAAAQAAAEAAGSKVLMLSLVSYQVPKGALASNAYRLASGKESCTHAQEGVYIDGPKAGTRVLVCTDKTCEKHFPKPKQAADRGTAPRTMTKAEQKAVDKRNRAHKKWQLQQKAQQARAERWAKVARQLRPLVREAVRKVKVVPPAVLQVMAARAMPTGTKIKKLGVSVTGDFARAVCVAHLAGANLEASYYEKDLRTLAKALKVDVAALEKAAAPPAPKKAKKGKK